MTAEQPLLHPKRASIAKLHAWLDRLDSLGQGKADDLAQAIDRLVASAAAGELHVFVGDVKKGFALPIRATAWGGSHGGTFDARASAASGWLVIKPAGFPENALERALAYQPLFYRRSSLPEWASIRNPKPTQAVWDSGRKIPELQWMVRLSGAP